MCKCNNKGSSSDKREQLSQWDESEREIEKKNFDTRERDGERELYNLF